MVRISLVALALLAVAGQARATWADAMFDELSRDFGSVPHGQVLVHPFRLVNNTGSTVRIAGVRPSCGLCTQARALTTVLAPGQETAILVTMNTRVFYNAKNVTIFVTFDQPRYEEVRLWIQANSRDDVSFSGNGIEFGRVKRGTTPASAIKVTFQGDGNTRVLEAKSDSNYVQPTLREIARGQADVTYEVAAKIRADIPAGKWYTDVWVKTNNPNVPKLRVPVTVEVEATLSANPNTVSLGQVKAGAELDRKVIIRGVTPFRITGISGTDNQIRVIESNAENKTVHVLTVTLNPVQPGLLSRLIHVHTDLQNGGDIEFNAQADVIP
jgi:hypothetical protein